MSQSRRLSSWHPLARCTVECEMNRCDMSAAFDRWDDWFDGNEHVVHPAAKFSTFRRQAREAAQRRGLSVVVEHAGQAVALRALLEVAA